MTLTVEPSGQACGARVTGLDLAAPISAALAAEIRAVWLAHKVLAFPGQPIDDDALERFTLAMGGFGEDPFFRPIPGRCHVAAIRREPDETTPLFAENWHSDWSFLPHPPAGTCLMAVDIPPVGGDTHPLVKLHPETGEETLFGCAGYIIGIDGMADAEAHPLLVELLQLQVQDRFIYRHQWEPHMLLLWDNRCVLHRATGGYEGHRRELHRTTIAARAA